MTGLDRCLIRSADDCVGPPARLGVPLLDDYLEFVSGRCSRNTVLATAFDLTVFFRVVAKPPGAVTTADVLGFITAQRAGAGAVGLRVVDGFGGVSTRTVRRRLFTAVAGYLDTERPAQAATDRVFLVLKGPRRGQPLSAYGIDEILDGARRRAGLAHATCHELRHTCLTRLREAGMALEAVQAQAGHRSIESTRIYLHLANDWLAGEYLRAVELIDGAELEAVTR